MIELVLNTNEEPNRATHSNRDAIPPQIPLCPNSRKRRGNERKRVEDRRRVHKKNKHNHQMMFGEKTTTESTEEPIQETPK
jgi:hypothetical protein